MQQGQPGVPIGGFVSAQLAQIRALWREFHALTPDSDTYIAQLLTQLLDGSQPVPPDFVEHPRPSDFPSVSISIPHSQDFTLSPFVASSKMFTGNILSSPRCPLINEGELEPQGCHKWWAQLKAEWHGSALVTQRFSL